MRKIIRSHYLLLISILAASTQLGAAEYSLKPVPFNEVEMTSSFWRPRLVTQRETLVPWAFNRTEPGVAHLQAAADHMAGKKVDHKAHRFIDSDLYKVIEGAAYLADLNDDPELEKQIDALAEVIAAAQEEDGYLYPSHTTGVGSEKNMMGNAPYEYVVHSHELYNVGHLYEAAVAYYQATGKDNLLKIAEKSAQHINKVVFEGGDPRYNGGKALNQAPGHQEMELALVKLHQVTGKQLYLDMARKLLEIRGVTYVPDGEGVLSPTYAQQHAPVKEQSEAVGHAVRATYQYAAMADVGTLTDDPDYGKALDRIWADITNTRMHITGGLGAVHGIEGFGPQFELPNAHAFNETCAAVGNVLFNYRMFLLHKDAKYLDVAEVSLLNNVMASVNFEGNKFFYVNPLDADGKHPFNHGTAGRAPWFGTACCPSNMARLLPQVQGMTYAHDAANLYLTFYAESKTSVNVGGTEVAVEQVTDYPNDGAINVKLSPKKATKFSVHVRIPTWARDQFVPGELYDYVDKVKAPYSVSVNGKKVTAKLKKGFVVIDRKWKKGDEVSVNLPMPLRVSDSREEVEENRNRIAFTRGPFVLCAEGVDNAGVTQRYYFDTLPDLSTVATKTSSIEFGSFIQLTLPTKAVNAEGESEFAYLTLTPYYAWNNRGPGSMTVWFPRKQSMAIYDPLALPQESIFAKLEASYTAPDAVVTAMVDGHEPKWSSGNKDARWASTGQEGKKQWVMGHFKETKQVRNIGIFWLDRWNGTEKFPQEWSCEVLQGGEWKPFELYVTDRYDMQPNRYNMIHPAAPLHCDGIRINITPKKEQAVGILEIKVTFEE